VSPGRRGPGSRSGSLASSSWSPSPPRGARCCQRGNATGGPVAQGRERVLEVVDGGGAAGVQPVCGIRAPESVHLEIRKLARVGSHDDHPGSIDTEIEAAPDDHPASFVPSCATRRELTGGETRTRIDREAAPDDRPWTIEEIQSEAASGSWMVVSRRRDGSRSGLRRL
jgi:hypothetical protein